MVRLAHLADTHLGYKQYNLEEREKDIYDALEEIGDKILEEHADIVVHSGDLFDSPRPTPQAYFAFKKFLKKLDGKVKFFAVLATMIGLRVGVWRRMCFLMIRCRF